MFRKLRRYVGLGMAMAMVVVLIPCLALGEKTISIVGEVSEDFQLTTDDDQIFEIVTDDKGEELIGHAGERVKVTGEIIEEGADRSIKVLSYEVLK
ncbi:MAG: hypothetical protein E4H15_03550 [Syntrophobacterales bacterium]|nr:MAG: hypothetical protein E4H15_03550 [Syntrophobacterales bacterium]